MEGVLIALSPSIFFVAVSSVIRGYFNGMYNMKATSNSQMIEQFFKSLFTIVIVFILYLMVPAIGKIENMKFSPSLFLDKNEEKCIIEKSIRKIINKQIDLKNKVRDKDKDAQDIKDLVANYEEELEK